MNLSLSVLRHLIKGKARCNNTNRCTQWYDDLCAERHVVLGVFESRQNVKYNFDIFKIFFRGLDYPRWRSLNHSGYSFLVQKVREEY